MPHRPSLPRRAGAAGAAAAVLPAIAAAQPPARPTVGVALPAATIAVDDPATAAVDQLLALTAVPGGITGQRPYSTREVARLARAAAAGVDARARAGRPDAADGRVRALAAALLAAYAPEGAPAPRARQLVARPLDMARTDAVATSADPVRFVADNGLGRIDAVTTPALDPLGGRPAVRGAATSFETAHAVGLGGWLALVAQPRVALVLPAAGALPGALGALDGARWSVEPQRLFARAVARNVALQAGIDAWGMGQGGEAGAFVSNNARPLRALSLQSDTAFALPWALRRLGRWRATFLYADLGRGQNFPHAKLATYKVSLAARPTVEIGAGMMSQFGGVGAPGMSFYQRTADLFPFIGWLDEGSDLIRSNKRANLDARLRIPRLRGLTVAYELTVDDFDLRRVRSTLWEDSGNLLTLSLPRLTRDGAFGFDLRAQRTGLREYRHYQFLSGMTYRGQVLGAPLGPNAGAVSAALTHRPRPLDAVALTVTREFRDPSRYANLNESIPNATLDFAKVAQGVVDRRLRGALSWERGGVGRGMGFSARGGLERVEGEAFVAGPAVVRAFAEAGARMTF